MDSCTVIQEYISETVAKGAKPSLAKFVATHLEYLAENTLLTEDPATKWTSLFQEAIARDNVVSMATRSKPDWKSVVARIREINAQPASSSSSSSPANPPRSSSSSTPANPSPSATSKQGTKRTKSSSGSKSDSYPMTDKMMAEYELAYKSLENTKKWKLPDGSYVEDILYQFGQQCTHEHLAHSFVLNMSDPQVKEVFTAEQYQFIRNAGIPTLPPLKDNVKNIFTDISDIIKSIRAEGDAAAPRTKEQEEKIVENIWEKITSYGFFHPQKHFDEDWLQRTLLDILNWFRFDALDLFTDNPSEIDFIVQIWSIIDKCFLDIGVQARRDHTCRATTVRENAKRGVTGTSCIEEKQLAVRPDLIFYRNGIEYGAGEVGKEDLAGVGKKELIETQLHCPKILKDMMNLVAIKCGNKESLLRSLRFVAYNQTHLRMSVSVLDCPGGYVCRVRTTPSYEIFRRPSLLLNGVMPILKLALMSKDIVKQGTAEVEQQRMERADEDPGFEDKEAENPADKTIILPPVARTSEKRQKL